MKIMREKKDEKIIYLNPFVIQIMHLHGKRIVIQAHFKSFDVRISVHPNFYLLILYKYT